MHQFRTLALSHWKEDEAVPAPVTITIALDVEEGGRTG
jgi:hypothetical protein